jgi:polyisoprenoid-binding protein YceI
MPPPNLALVVLTALCLVLIAQPEPARADSISLNLDPTQSTVGFTLGAVLHSVRGTFALKQGAITFDSATGQAGGNVVVDLASGQSGDAKRDANMRNNVLQVQTYPFAVFTASRVQGKLANGTRSALDVDGMLAIHGGSHAMTLHVMVDTKGASMTATTQFSVPYVQWGMKNPSTFLLHVGNTVDVDIAAVGAVHLLSGNAAPSPSAP